MIGEAGAVLTAVANVGTAAGLIPYTDAVTGELVSNSASHVDKIVNGFLPDVMRLDMTASLGVNDTAYVCLAAGCIGVIQADGVSGASNVSGIILAGGRKIKDDVIDVTFNYLAG